jgi:hypothetical protein
MDFPDGTVIVKLLFTSATDAEAAYLKDSKLVWRTDLNRARKTKLPDNIDSFPKLRLLQIDLAVRDHRANQYSGWVFGTFVYNAKKNVSSEIGEYNDWELLEPLGLMFGNDPTVAKNGFENLNESLINASTVRSQHLGCGQRLNGAVDNPKSSCIACHARETQVRFSINEKVNFATITYETITYDKTEPSCEITNGILNRPDLLYWFRNVSPGQTFSKNTSESKYYPLHNVLQLQIGITRYCDAFPQNCNESKTIEKFKKKGIQNLIMQESTRGDNQ